MKTRQPAVAGRFYPDNKAEINQMLSKILEQEKKFIDLELGNKNIIGAVVPHAGYMFSAYQALHFFELLKNSNIRFDTFFIINPDHSGYGEEISLDVNDYWETPYGKVEIDKDFYDFFEIAKSEAAHKQEHSGEVMLPLLQNSLDYDYKIVPITLSRQIPENAKSIAEAIYKANLILKKRVCIIASSDFSHFVHPDEGRHLDNFVIEKIISLDSYGVFNEVKEKNISVCGYGPIMTLIEYAKLVSEAPNTQILKIGHSGEVIPSNEVVDYVSILFYQ